MVYELGLGEVMYVRTYMKCVGGKRQRPSGVLSYIYLRTLQRAGGINSKY